MAVKTKSTNKKLRIKKHSEITPKAKPDRPPFNLDTEIAVVRSDYYALETGWNPDDLVGKKGLEIYEQIRKDEQVKASLFAKKFAVLSTGYEIQEPEVEEEDAELAKEMRDFVEFNFEEMAGSFKSKLFSVMTGLDYGFSISEMILHMIDFGQFNGKIGLKDLKTRHPIDIDFIQDRYGNLEKNGVQQSGKRLPSAKFLIWSYRNEFSNIYGNSDLREVYRPFWNKQQAYKHMTIVLERFGDPITIISHEGTITQPQREQLENFIKWMQVRSGLVLPDKVKVEFKTPDPQVTRAFVPAINLFDAHIRIGLLMTGLLGLSAEQQTGSFARALKEFDVFLWILNDLRQEIETLIDEGLIKFLVDLNYEVTNGKYPRFRFKEITEEHRQDIFKLWISGVQAKAISVTDEDENKGRDLIGFPPLPKKEEGEGRNGDDGDDNEGRIVPAAQWVKERHMIKRTLTKFEKRVDFKKIENTFNREAQKTDNKLRKIMRDVQQDTISRAERMISEGLDARSASEFTVDVGHDFSITLNSFLADMWRSGRDEGMRELPPRVRRELSDLKEFAFEPQEAIDYFQAKTLHIKGVVDSNLEILAQLELLNHMESGRSQTETIKNLREIFEPYVGDPTKIAPSGPGRPRPENLLQAHRLENMIRTPMTGAFNQGRLTVGATAGEFVRGYEYSAILDTRTTKTDRRADGIIIRADDPRLPAITPPLHFQCRGILVFVTEEDLPIKFSSNARIDRVVRMVPSGFGGKA